MAAIKPAGPDRTGTPVGTEIVIALSLDKWPPLQRRCADYSPNNRGFAMAGQRVGLNVRVTMPR
jgi:hypothetical protein